jgi:hypothetical protein
VLLRAAVVEGDLLGVLAQLHAAVAEVGLDSLAEIEQMDERPPGEVRHQQHTGRVRIHQIDHVSRNRKIDAPQREVQRAGQIPQDDGEGDGRHQHVDRVEEQLQRQLDEAGDVLRDALVRVVQASVALDGVVRPPTGPGAQQPARHGGAPFVLLQLHDHEQEHHRHQHGEHAGDPGQAQALPDVLPLPLHQRIHHLALELVAPDRQVDAGEHQRQSDREQDPATPAFPRRPVGQDQVAQWGAGALGVHGQSLNW